MAILYRIYWYSRLCLLWSWLYRCLYQRKYRSVPIEEMGTPDAVQGRLNILKWKKDSFRELWDAIGSPHWVQHCINTMLSGNDQPDGAMDCDEFAVWAAKALIPFYKPVVLNVFWRSKTYSGHNVCLYQMDGAFYSIGNWGKMGPKSSAKAMAEAIASRADGALIGWAEFTPDLRLVSVMK